jgi:predicted nuclease of predicted toxin-antitoxin system
MRILADENVPGIAVATLRDQGHDVSWIREESPGAEDITILAKATEEERLLVTFDKDFGELAFRRRVPSPQGIVLFRISMPSADYVARVALTALESRSDWAGHFAVIEDDRIRLVPLPQPRNGTVT